MQYFYQMYFCKGSETAPFVFDFHSLGLVDFFLRDFIWRVAREAWKINLDTFWRCHLLKATPCQTLSIHDHWSSQPLARWGITASILQIKKPRLTETECLASGNSKEWSGKLGLLHGNSALPPQTIISCRAGSALGTWHLILGECHRSQQQREPDFYFSESW